MAVDPARRVAHRVLARVEEDGAWSDRALASEASRAGLQGRDRALAGYLVSGTVKHRRTLDHVVRVLATREPAQLDPPLRDAVRLGAFQLLFADRIPPHAAVATSVELAKREGRNRAGVVNALLRRVADGGRALVASLPEETPEQAALALSYPDWLAHLWFRAYGDETARALLRAGNEPAEQAVRINTLRPGARERVEATLAEAGCAAHGDAAAPDALVLEGAFDLAGSALLADGDAVPMSRSAQRIAPLLEPVPGMRVLDACAAPGGKSGHLAALLGGGAGLVCAERNPARARELGEALARQGAADATVVEADAAALPAELGAFDRILLDAPCTGLGTLGSRADLRWRRVPGDVARLAAEQRRLLDALLGRLAPGGRLVYAVCTLMPAENREVVDACGATLVDELLLRPDRDGGEGFYAALLEP